MSSEFFLELSEYSKLTSEKNSEFRIKVENDHPYLENIVRFGNYIPSQLGENFRISFATFGAISELHSEKISELYLEKIFEVHLLKSFRTTFGQKFCINFLYIKSEKVDLCLTMKSFNIIYFLFYFNSSKKKQCPLSL